MYYPIPVRKDYVVVQKPWASRGFSVINELLACTAVGSSVCLSVTLQHCVKTAKPVVHRLIGASFYSSHPLLERSKRRVRQWSPLLKAIATCVFG